MRSIGANASSAPWACMAGAMPQAMERSVARPTISARLPVKKPIYILQAVRAELTGSMRPRPIGCLALLAVRVDVPYQPLSGSDLMMPVQAVPALELRNRELKLPRNAVDRVAVAYGVEHAAAGPHSLIAITPRACLEDQALTLHQGVAGFHVIQAGERAHRHAVAARNAAQRLTRANAIDELTLLASANIRAVHSRRGEQHLVRHLSADLGNPQRFSRAHLAALQIVDLGNDGGRRAVLLGDRRQRFAARHLVNGEAHPVLRRQGLERRLEAIGLIDGYQHAVRTVGVGGPAVVARIQGDELI